MQMPLDLRSKANDALDQARMLVESGDEAQIRHGCLELRFCIEYLILDRFRWYQEYIDDEAAKKWTPKKVIEELLENDPHADTTAQIAVGIEKEYGVPSDDMHVLGTDHRLRLKWANSNWNALGNFLHAPSLDQLTSGAVPSLPVMKARAGDIIAHLTKVLATPVWNVSGGEIFELKCEDCGIITKRFAAKVEKDQSLTCKTPDCGAIHDLVDGSKAIFRVRQKPFKCPKCEHEALFRAHFVEAGNTLICEKCDTRWRLFQGLFAEEIPNTEAMKEQSAGSSSA
jgi:predicted RNA-binding Zn-ribbon protein involved in translation (DUF1610 family)